MFVTIVHVNVKDVHVEDFKHACEANHLASVQESGNRRFDSLQSKESPSQFILYEAYENESAAKAHKETKHYLQWRETVADWMASPRKGVLYDGLFPE